MPCSFFKRTGHFYLNLSPIFKVWIAKSNNCYRMLHCNVWQYSIKTQYVVKPLLKTGRPTRSTELKHQNLINSAPAEWIKGDNYENLRTYKVLLFFLATHRSQAHNLIFFNLRPDYIHRYVYLLHDCRKKTLCEFDQPGDSPSIFTVGRQQPTWFPRAEHRPITPRA